MAREPWPKAVADVKCTHQNRMRFGRAIHAVTWHELSAALPGRAIRCRGSTDRRFGTLRRLWVGIKAIHSGRGRFIDALNKGKKRFKCLGSDLLTNFWRKLVSGRGGGISRRRCCRTPGLGTVCLEFSE